MDLKKVFRKEMTLNEVVEKTKRDISDIMEKDKDVLIEGSYAGAGNKSGIGKCPLCGGSVLPGKKNYYCSNYKEKECGFIVWKTIAGKEVSEEHVKQLLEKGKTSLMKGFAKKAGGTFDAYLVLDETGEVKFEFLKRRKGRK